MSVLKKDGSMIEDDVFEEVEPKTQLSTEEFTQQLEREIRQICSTKEWNYDMQAHRGWAFQFWVAALLRKRDRGITTDPEEGVLLTHDGGIDIILEDPEQKVVYVVQTKLSRISSKRPPIVRDEVEAFFAKHELMMNREWAKKNISKQIIDLIGYYNDLFSQDYKASFCFISTLKDEGGKCRDLSAAFNNRFRMKGDVRFDVIDFYELKKLYIEAQTLEQSIPKSVNLSLIEGRWFIKDKPRRTLIATVKANALVNVYRKHKETMFAYNIRSFLGRKGINRDIIETAEKDPSSFFYFNNGISAVCNSFDVDHDTQQLTGIKFQIINGAQTVGALSVASVSNEVEVLMRVTEGLSVSTEKGFNADIIRYNNTQNIVKSSDFRSNDPSKGSPPQGAGHSEQCQLAVLV
jgi:hypothetical protein